MELFIPGFTFEDLFDPARLSKLTDAFREFLKSSDPQLHSRYGEYSSGRRLSDQDLSRLLVEIAPYVGDFLARLFGIESLYAEMKTRADRDGVIFRVKKEFFIRRVLRKYPRRQDLASPLPALESEGRRIAGKITSIPRGDEELEIAAAISVLLGHERYIKTELPANSRNALAALSDTLGFARGKSDEDLKRFLEECLQTFELLLASWYHEGTPKTKAWALLHVPHGLDMQHLVETTLASSPVPGEHTGVDSTLRRRDGFDLTDPRFSMREVESEIDYCIFCHERDKDSCSKGFRTDEGYKKNALGFTLKGCPLDQKISESQLLMGGGDALGALAVIMLDNPMVPGTGHRICNDCMKACIYQKQDPVNIPQIETRILTEVLDLPFGFEIYSLLSRWNPLNVDRPSALPYNGMNILIVGLGPAGYTLAHYFLNEGFGVVAIDGLKIEPLPESLAGDGRSAPPPVKDFRAIRTPLSARVLAGFGGVSEYGITVRWDKNFLTVLHLNLARRQYFRTYDGVRFGGTFTLDDAWEHGFTHVCFASGAGKPTFVSMKNNLIRGVRKASDFLMALQLTGAGKTDSMANLQVRLPALVIGGGLTAIDTATELMAYYPVQVTKVKHRYDALVVRFGKESIERMFDEEELSILREFLSHGDAIQAERRRASAAGELPDFIPLLQTWGGVHIYYRKSMLDSPAYRLNHEEIIKSLEEGISFVECMSPLEAVPDPNGAVREMSFERMMQREGRWKASGEVYRIPARAVFVAAGTVPNIMYEREHPGTFALDDEDQFFQTFSLHGDGTSGHLVPVAQGEEGFFTSYARDGKYVTYYGDNHPGFAGNVVKAMASAKQGYRAVLSLLEEELRAARMVQVERRAWEDLVHRLDDELRARVVTVNRLTPTITEVVVRAPKAARAFRPGQFYRLQQYEVDSPRVENTLVMMEGVALTGAWVDTESGDIGLIALEVGASSRMCALLQPGQHVVVMGPTGSPTEITEGGTVLLLGGGLGNAVLFSIAKAYKEKGNTVIYFAGYKKKEDLFKREEIEAHTDIVIYSVDSGEKIETRRPGDRTLRGTIIQAMLAYARGELGPVGIPLEAAERIIAIGSDRMMSAVAKARYDDLQPYLSKTHVGIASINSPMQCMMKAVCAQCLQRHTDPRTGKEEFVFTCVNQDQLMDEVDFGNLSSRLKANSVMEKISSRWLDYIFEKHPMPRV
ncbi:MAG TPA: FAD-dependent oxidoreductase [Bacteroidota bacterium]|nr:FAD-dependent oxidoreductase [Bacteroidota bacterium]